MLYMLFLTPLLFYVMFICNVMRLPSKNHFQVLVYLPTFIGYFSPGQYSFALMFHFRLRPFSEVLPQLFMTVIKVMTIESNFLMKQVLIEQPSLIKSCCLFPTANISLVQIILRLPAQIIRCLKVVSFSQLTTLVMSKHYLGSLNGVFDKNSALCKVHL